MIINQESTTKEAYINRLFASAAARYDFLNAVMSFGRHKAWRRFAVRRVGLTAGSKALDVAAGTCDFTLELLRVVGPTGLVVGVDFCLPMLEIGQAKLAPMGPPALAVANAERLPFPDGSFDCATIGFALRNVDSVPVTLAEMARVVRPGGRVVSLEILGPESGIIRPFWRLYFNRVLPLLSQLLGGEKEAYKYLPSSVARFHSRQELRAIMEQCNLDDVRVWDLALGAVCVHVGTRK